MMCCVRKRGVGVAECREYRASHHNAAGGGQLRGGGGNLQGGGFYPFVSSKVTKSGPLGSNVCSQISDSATSRHFAFVPLSPPGDKDLRVQRRKIRPNVKMWYVLCRSEEAVHDLSRGLHSELNEGQSVKHAEKG